MIAFWRSKSYLTVAALVALVGCLSAVDHCRAESLRNERGAWPSFQGPAVPELKSDDLPLEWSPEKNIAWQATVPGYGQSSPVAWNSQVFVTSVRGAMKETCHLIAIDMATGKVNWEHSFPSASQVESTNYVSKAAPTPVVDQNGIIALFEVGNVVALDHHGKPRWSKNLVEEYGEIPSRHGLGSSLTQNDEYVFVWIERQTDPYLLAIEKSSGKTAWKVPGLSATSWSTPVLLTVEGDQHLVLSGGGIIAGIDPKSGKRLWTFEGLSGNTTPTPRPYADGLLLVAATVGRGEQGGGKASESNGMLQVRPDGKGSFNASFKWQCKRATSSFGSPVAHQGLAYFVNGTGVVFCIDAETGEEIYSERLGDSIWATPIAAGNRIYFAGKSGTTTVIEAGKSFNVLAQNRVWKDEGPPPSRPEGRPESQKSERKGPPSGEGSQRVQYAIAAVSDSIFIRTGDTLFCVRAQATTGD